MPRPEPDLFVVQVLHLDSLPMVQQKAFQSLDCQRGLIVRGCVLQLVLVSQLLNQLDAPEPPELQLDSFVADSLHAANLLFFLESSVSVLKELVQNFSLFSSFQLSSALE